MISGTIRQSSYLYFSSTSEMMPLPRLTRAMGSFPDEGWSVGDVHERMGSTTTRHFTVWTIYPADLAAGIPEQLESLLPRVVSAATTFTPTADVGTGLTIIHKITPLERQPGIVVDPNWLRLLARLGSSLGIDQYADEPEPNDPAAGTLAESSVQLRVVSRRLSTSQLAKRFDAVPDEPDPTGDAAEQGGQWAMSTSGHISTMEQLDDMTPRLVSVAQAWDESADPDAEWTLTFTQTVGRDRQTTIGIPLDEPWVKHLAHLGARVVVQQRSP